MHVCVNKQQNSMPLGLAPIQRLAYSARGSRWHLCTVSDFRLQVILGADLASSQCSVGASWHTPSGRNTESAWVGPVLWLRWWWWWWKYCIILFSTAMCHFKWPFGWGLWGAGPLRSGSKLGLHSCALKKCSSTEECFKLQNCVVILYSHLIHLFSPVWKSVIVLASFSVDDIFYL